MISLKNDPLAWSLQQGAIPELGNKEKKERNFNERTRSTDDKEITISRGIEHVGSVPRFRKVERTIEI